MPAERVVIIGAGIGGLSAAVGLAAAGVEVVVLERASQPGGKMREVRVGGRPIDAGPTVFTMRWVFEQLFAAAGTSLEAELALEPAELLARHAWSSDERLDLFVDLERSVEAVSAFAGAAEADRFRAFARQSADVYATLRDPFLKNDRPGPVGLARRIGWGRFPEMLRLQPFSTLWRALGNSFRDPRLVQLFGRYATYCGSSPFLAPATLMLVAHVEQDGVWTVNGGMARLAEALGRVATRHGAWILCDAEVERIEVAKGRVSGVRLANGDRFDADVVLANADCAALATGLFGNEAARAVAPVPRKARSLSAVAHCALARPEGFPLVRHTVFFSQDYAREFDQIVRGRRLPDDPTVYICAQDRDATADGRLSGPAAAAERLLCLVNAPAEGDARPFDAAEVDPCLTHMNERLSACGLTLREEASVTTSPAGFASLFPATGGALYGRASHGWQASFARPNARTSLPGLYLAGGSVHPGPGVPMASLSGQRAVASILSDFASTRRSHPVAISGGMSMRSAQTASSV